MKTWQLITPADWLIIALAVTAVGASAWVWRSPDPGGGPAVVQVHHGGDLKLSAPLGRDGRYRVSGPLGDSEIVVAGGQARFGSAPCPDLRCVQSAPLDRRGTATFCVPNALVLSIEGDYDALAF